MNRGAALAGVFFAAFLAAAACSPASLPFGSATPGTPTPTPTPTSLPAAQLPGRVRAIAGLGKVTVEWDTIPGAQYNVYYLTSTAATITRANAVSLGGVELQGIAPPAVLLALPQAPLTQILVTAVVGTSGEGDGLAPVLARPLPTGNAGLVPSTKRIAWHGSRPYGWAGHALVGADVDGDGMDDLVVGSPTTVGTDSGHVFVFYATTTGIAAASVPDDVSFGDAGAQYGYSLAAGHIHSPTYADVIVGAPAASSMVTANFGAAVLLEGSVIGLGSDPAWKVSGGNAGDAVGSAVASGCDVDGDGSDDVLVGAATSAKYGAGEGFAWLFRTGGTGTSLPDTTAAQEWSGGGANAGFGTAIACVADLNSDAKRDALFGAPGTSSQDGGVFWAAGQSNLPGLSSSVTGLFLPTTPSNAGASVADAGDVDGDGSPDAVFGAPIKGGTGAAYLVGSGPTVGAPFYTGATGSQAGAAVASVDVNGDGYTDVLVGAPAEGGTGAVHLFLGGPSGLTSTPQWSATGGAGSLFGGALAAFPRGNLDSSGDFAVGAYEENNGAATQAGAVYVYYGPPRSGPDADVGPPASVNVGAPFTFSAAKISDPGWDASVACDVDWGDGLVPDSFPSCTTSVLSAQTHEYSAPGTYVVRIRASNTAYGTYGESIGAVVAQ